MIPKRHTCTLCELSEHAPIHSEAIECHYNKEKQFSPSAQEQDYYDNDKPSLDYMYATGENLTSSELADNETSTQLRLGIKKQRLRDRVEKLDESLSKDLSRYAKIDAQRGYAQGVNINAISESLNAQTGITINLIDKKANKSISSVIILKTRCKAEFPNALDEYVEDMADTKEAQYSVEFDAIPSEIIYKPDTSIDKPKIYSLQTAIVSNANKETSKYANQIDVNEKGEIRVIFHFDKEKTTSVYIPLANIYSGDGYGSQFLPRVNSQVLVSYINGDIDRPIITGALHNAQNSYAYNLPKEKTKSFIKTQTTPQYEDKEGYNELLFEDKQGEELLSLRAQKDYKLHALHDSQINIDNDQVQVVGNNEKVSIGNDETINIANDKTTSIGKNDSLTVSGNQTETVMMNKAESILIAKALSVGAGYQVTVGGAKNETVGLSSTEEVGILKHIIAGKRFELSVGDSSLILNSDGTIVLKGNEVLIEGSKQVTVNGKLVEVN